MTARIGVEEEFHVVEVESGLLVPRAGTVLRELDSPVFTTELQQTIVETNSGVHRCLDDLHRDVVGTRRRLDVAAAAHGLAAAAAGTVPLGSTAAARNTEGRRYERMVDEYRKVADEQLICGAHVHVDVPDRDLAVRIMCEVSPWLHVLLALSASSPFWLGDDTGYASWRTEGEEEPEEAETTRKRNRTRTPGWGAGDEHAEPGSRSRTARAAARIWPMSWNAFSTRAFVIAGDIRINLLDIQLLTIKLRLVVLRRQGQGDGHRLVGGRPRPLLPRPS